MNWPFLMFTGFPVAAHGGDQVGLAAEERRDLQAVRHLGGGLGLAGLVDVGQRQPGLGLHPRQDAQALVEARPAVGAQLERLALSTDALNTIGNVVACGDSSRS